MNDLELTKRLIERASEIFFEGNELYKGKRMTFDLANDDQKTDLSRDITEKLKEKFPPTDKKDLISISTLKRYHRGQDKLSVKMRSILCAYVNQSWKDFVHEEMLKDSKANPKKEGLKESSEQTTHQSANAESSSKSDSPEIQHEGATVIKDRFPLWLKVATILVVATLIASAIFMRNMSSSLGQISSTIKEGPSREPAIVDMPAEQSWLVDDRKELDNREESKEDKDVIRLQPVEKSEIVPEVERIVRAEEPKKNNDGASTPKPVESNKTTSPGKGSTQNAIHNAAENAEVAVYAVKNGKVNNSLAGSIRNWVQQQNVPASISQLKPDFYNELYFDRIFDGDASFLSESKIADQAPYLFLLKTNTEFSVSKVQPDLTIGKANYEIVVVDCITGTVIDSYDFTHTKPGVSKETIERDLQDLLLQEMKNHPLPIK